MGHWGVRSFENDDAADALDAGFEQVHGARYEELMDDRNPLTPEQIERQLANPATLDAAIAALVDAVGPDLAWDDWDDEARLAYAGVVVRHAELDVPIPPEPRDRAIAWLRGEAIDWDEATARRLRVEKEVARLSRALGPA